MAKVYNALLVGEPAADVRTISTPVDGLPAETSIEVLDVTAHEHWGALSWVRPLAKQDSAAISRRTEDLQRYLQTLLDEPWAWANRPVLRHFLQVPLAVWRDQQAAATRSFQDARKRHESTIGPSAAERSDPKSRSARSSARSKAL